MDQWSQLDRFSRGQFFVQQTSIRKVIFLLLASFGIIGWLYVLLASDAFMVREVEVIGAKFVQPENIEGTFFKILDLQDKSFWHAPRHRLFIDREAIIDKLANELFLSSVKLDFSSLNIVRLIISEDRTGIDLRTPSSRHLLDWQGFNIPSSHEREWQFFIVESQDLSITTDNKIINSTNTRSRIIAQDKIKIWLDIEKACTRLNVSCLKLLREPVDTRASVLIINKKQMLIDENIDVATQIAAAKKVLDAAKEPYSIIDARISGRVYVR